MISAYIVGLFFLGIVSVYALIQSRSNRFIVFLLIPLILSMTLYTWQAVTYLQGTAIEGIPEEQEMEIIYITVRKPDILFLVQHKDRDRATFYSIPWTKENAKKASRLRKLAESGINLRGKFTKKQRNGGESKSPDWQQVLDYSVDNPKNSPQH